MTSICRMGHRGKRLLISCEQPLCRRPNCRVDIRLRESERSQHLTLQVRYLLGRPTSAVEYRPGMEILVLASQHLTRGVWMLGTELSEMPTSSIFWRSFVLTLLLAGQMYRSNRNDLSGGRRQRYVVDLQSELIQHSGRTLDGAALAATTTKTYSSRWDQYQDFCVDHAREPILTGTNQKRDLETLLLYAAFEYVMHGNSYETVRGEMYAIRWFVIEHDYPDPFVTSQSCGNAGKV